MTKPWPPPFAPMTTSPSHCLFLSDPSLHQLGKVSVAAAEDIEQLLQSVEAAALGDPDLAAAKELLVLSQGGAGHPRHRHLGTRVHSSTRGQHGPQHVAVRYEERAWNLHAESIIDATVKSDSGLY